MQLTTYSVLAFVAGVAASHGHERPARGAVKIPQIWSSPVFKSSDPADPAGSKTKPSLQQSFQLHEPAPLLTTTRSRCSVTLVERSFANSYGSPSTLAFDPRAAFAGTQCADPQQWTGLTLDVHGETRGRQFDRLGTVWVGNNATGQGVEVMRLDNPEPTQQGVVWDTSKDVGRYYALFSRPADVLFDLPNIVDDTYTGALNVSLSLTASVQGTIAQGRRHAARAAHPQSRAAAALRLRAPEVVIPLSKRLQTGNSVFQIGGTAGNASTAVQIPRNAARALVEVYASGTATEEFWYTGIPDRFYNQIPDAAADGYYGHGPYREVQLYIDGTFAGFVTPYPVIYTGGINPLLWRPAANYGTFDQPTYTIDVTPFLGTLTDDEPHTFELAVVSPERGGAINDASWYVSANVQLYLDSSEARTTGAILKHSKDAEYVRATATGSLTGDPLTNGSLTYTVRLSEPRRFGVEGSVKTGSGEEYVAGWYQQAEYSNVGVVNATTQTNDQKSFGWTRSLVLAASNVAKGVGDVQFDDLQHLPHARGVQAVQMDYNYPLYVTSSLSDTEFDANVLQSFDRTVRTTGPSRNAIAALVGDESTFVGATPVPALPHSILVQRVSKADSSLVNGAIKNGTGEAQQSFMYRDMAANTIDRVTRTNTTNVLQDDVKGSAASRAQPMRLVGQ